MATGSVTTVTVVSVSVVSPSVVTVSTGPVPDTNGAIAAAERSSWELFLRVSLMVFTESVIASAVAEKLSPPAGLSVFTALSRSFVMTCVALSAGAAMITVSASPEEPSPFSFEDVLAAKMEPSSFSLSLSGSCGGSVDSSGFYFY